MRQRPMVIAFVIAACGAAAIASVAASRVAGGDWAPILMGAALAAAMTGLASSGLQFLPNRIYSPMTIVLGLAVAAAVFVLLRAIEYVGFGRLPSATVVVWAIAAIVALVVGRESGVRLPPVHRPPAP